MSEFREFLNEQLKDPEVKAEYDALEPEFAIIRAMIDARERQGITQKELAGIIGKSERTIKTRTVEMQEKGLIRRENGKRNGRWEVLVNI